MTNKNISDLATAFQGTGSLFSEPQAVDSTSILMLELDSFLGEGDISWKSHRSVKVNEDRLDWAFPQGAAERGKSPRVTEITRKEQFVAFRGIYLGSSFGFILMADTPNKGWEVVCRTTEAKYHLGANSFSTKSGKPLDILPIPLQPHQSKDLMTTYNKALERIHSLELFGSRPPVDYPGDPKDYRGTPRTCASCVAAGQNVMPDPKDPAKTIQCRGSGEALFCVFELGIIDPEWDATSGQKPKVVFKKIEDCGLVTHNGDQHTPLTRPFILRVESLGKAQTSQLGTGQYDIDVIMPEQPNSGDCYLPSGRGALSFGSFWREAVKRTKALPDGKPAYPFVTDLYVGQLRKPPVYSKTAPVFYVHDANSEIVRQGKTFDGNPNRETRIDDWVMTALVTRQNEELEAQGLQADPDPEFTAPERPAVQAAPTAPTAVSESEPKDTTVAAVEVVEETNEPEAEPEPTAAAPTRTATSFSAFNPVIGQ